MASALEVFIIFIHPIRIHSCIHFKTYCFKFQPNRLHLWLKMVQLINDLRSLILHCQLTWDEFNVISISMPTHNFNWFTIMWFEFAQQTNNQHLFSCLNCSVVTRLGSVVVETQPSITNRLIDYTNYHILLISHCSELRFTNQ